MSKQYVLRGASGTGVDPFAGVGTAIVSGAGRGCPTLGDADGDLDLDLVVGYGHNTDVARRGLSYFRNEGTTTSPN